MCTLFSSLFFLFFRFVDVSIDVRLECVRQAKQLLMLHPTIVSDVSGKVAIEMCI